MKIKARVIAADDKEIEPGALKATARDIPVTVGFDGSRVVGKATVYTDGTAEIEIDAPQERRPSGNEAEGVLGLGFVVEQERQDGGVRVLERIRPITVGISNALFDKAMKGER